MLWEWVLAPLVALGLVYWLAVLRSLEVFFRRRDAMLAGEELPPVSILKPVKGLDRDAYDNFASFCRLAYPRYELLFGVADPQDPALAVIRQLQRDFPHCEIRAIVAAGEARNPKTAILADLTAQARYPLLAISDSDIQVAADYLRAVVSPLSDPEIGVVTCLYRCQTPLRWSVRWEIQYLETDFLPGVIVAHEALGFCVGLGSTLVVRAADLTRAGGWAPMADYLADDYQLASRIAALGLRIHLSSCVVTQVLGGAGFREQWDRELRWARGVRCSCPYCYPGRLLTCCTPLALVLLLLAGPTPLAVGLLGAAVALRAAVAWRMQRHLGHRPRVAALVWLPVRDLATAATWGVAALGRRIRWRGRSFWLDRQGRLHELPQAGSNRRLMWPKTANGARRLAAGFSALPAQFGKPLVRQLDRLLRGLLGIREFSDDPQCVFRISLARSQQDFTLPDGTPVRRGDPVGELHLWNEHLPQIAAEGFDLNWAARLRGQGLTSFVELAEAVRRDRQLHQVKAWRAVIAPRAEEQVRLVNRLMRSMGFAPAGGPWPADWFSRLHDLGDDLLRWLLTWTFNPGGMRGRTLVKARQAYWISQRALVGRYAAEPTGAQAGPGPQRSPSF